MLSFLMPYQLRFIALTLAILVDRWVSPRAWRSIRNRSCWRSASASPFS